MSWSLTFGLGCIASIALAGDGPAEDWTGKVVIAAKPGKLQLRAGDKVVAETSMLAFKVVRQQDQWLELAGYPHGWLLRTDAVPLDRAVAHCTKMLSNSLSNTDQWLNLRGVAYYNLEQFDEALSNFDEAIRRNARSSTYFSNRGLVYARRGQFDRALVDFDQAIRLDAANAAAHVNRGNALRDKQDSAGAVASYNAAIAIEPKLAMAFYNRGLTYEQIGEYAKALADYSEVARIDAKDADAWNGIAWLLATAPDDKLRDGKKALECAKFACELSESKDANHLDTLAAAHAELGQFEDAVRFAGKALELAPEMDRPEIQSRIELFKSNKPFRSSVRPGKENE